MIYYFYKDNKFRILKGVKKTLDFFVYKTHCLKYFFMKIDMDALNSITKLSLNWF